MPHVQPYKEEYSGRYKVRAIWTEIKAPTCDLHVCACHKVTGKPVLTELIIKRLSSRRSVSGGLHLGPSLYIIKQMLPDVG